MILCCLLTGLTQAQSTENKTAELTSGSGTWTAPAGAWKIISLEAWGGGGGGGNATEARSTASGGGGGAHAVYNTVITGITPGSSKVTYSVGAAGGSAAAGGKSTIKYGTTVNLVANGGGAGNTATHPSSNNSTNTATGGTGGTASGCSSTDLCQSGSTPSNVSNKHGSSFLNLNHNNDNIGAGGAGGNAGGATSGAGGSQSSNAAGKAATAVGCGGGGAHNGSSSTNNSCTGGAGYRGQVNITYQILTLTVAFDANYTGGTNPTSQTVLYYDEYGTLPTVTRDNYIFLGWFTEANGGTQVTATTQHTSTQNVTLYAHWAYAGAITTATATLSAPCGDYTVSEATPHEYNGGVIYSWSYTVNNITTDLDVDKNELTQADLELNQMGEYTFTRYITANNQKVASEGTFTVVVPYLSTAGSITSGTKYLCTGAEFTINGVTPATTDFNANPTYSWTYTKNGGTDTPIDYSDADSYTTTILSAGTYVFKRYATLGCAIPQASDGSYTVIVAELPTANYDAPTSNYNEFCKGGTLELQSGNYNLAGVTAPYNEPSTFNWMISENGGNATSLGISTANLEQTFNLTGNYAVYVELEYFNMSVCKMVTNAVNISVVDDPTIGAPTVSSQEVCPSGSVDLTAANDLTGGVGGNYTYNWQFHGPDAQSDWVDVDATQATYSSTTGQTITASNFLVTGNVQYRTYINNPQGCDYHSDPAALQVIALPIPIVSTAVDVCPAPGDTSFTTMVSTTSNNYQLRWFADATSATQIDAPTTISLGSENVITFYVAQFDGECLSARVPVTLTITYTAHLGHDNGDLDQIVCQNSAMDAITFSHSGDCAPQVTFTKDGQSVDQIAGVTVTSGNGTTVIEGNPTEVATYTFHVVLQPTANTVCAAPNSFDGSIVVNPVYAVTDNQTICGGSYIISDTKGHSYSYNTSGTYTQTLESVTGCDSVVTLNLYVHEWNQFGFKENEELIAGWTSFSNVSSPISADVDGSAPGSQITYLNWNGPIANHGDNNPQFGLGSGVDITNISPSSSPLITNPNGHLLALPNQGSNGTLNNGKSIIVKSTTKDYGNINLHFDYGVQRTYYALNWSSNDKAFTTVKMYYSLDGVNYTNLSTLTIDLEEEYVTYGSCSLDMSTQSSRNIENADDIFVKFEFEGANKSSTKWYNYFMIDNLCISGKKIIELELTGETEACTNQSLTLVATPPYTNTNVNPPVTTPVVYKWERIVNGTSTVLDETSNILVDNEVQKGDYQYRVSVGDAPCGQSATLNVLGIEPAYRLDIERHGHVCSNKVDKVSNITFTDCDYVNGMFIVTPSAEDMRTPGTYECQLSIPTTENQCDSIIKLILDVRKAFDTTIVANICLGETYNLYGFDITPTEEGINYYTSDPTWTCSTGCDSIYRLTLITSSVRQTLVSESNVTLAAWPMDNGITNYTPACGVRTTGSSFMVKGASNVPPFTNAIGHTPGNDYCYTEASSNGALTWPNLASSCSGLGSNASYTDYSGAYFEIKLNPYDYENLKLKFDYKRENASTSSAQAFNQVRYSYKFSETGNYTNIGTVNLNSTEWASQTLNFSSANTLDHDVVYLKMEFIGGNAGGTQSCGTFSGSKYLPSYITVDNVMVWGDRPARATLNGPAQTCDQTYVCEGNDVTFNCQGDDQYFKFYVVDEIANDTTAFNGNPTLSITPIQSSTYKIVAVEQTTMCDSVWGPFNVEVVKNPTITITQGSLDLGICGNTEVNNAFLVENATSYTFTWLTDHNGLTETDDQAGNITITGTMTDGGSARYNISANPDDRCSSSIESKTGTIAIRTVPTFKQTIGEDTVCTGTQMQFVVDTTGCNFWQIDPNDRIKWYTQNEVLGIEDTLNYIADETKHSTRHYIMVTQNGCTTLDSIDIGVFNFDGDTLRLYESHYVLNYGDNFLDADSLHEPDLMHNNEVVPAELIQSISIRHLTGNKIPVGDITDMKATIIWDVVDICGYTHSKQQDLTFELPPCGDADHYTVTDYDGNEYSTVRIGLNCWLRENLKTLHYDDGTPVAVALGYVNNQFPNADNTADIFGRLYTWYSAMGVAEHSTTAPTVNEFGHVQGVCPEGWFVPDPEQFYYMRNIDMDNLRAHDYWLDGGGNNSTDFSILPGGGYNSDKDRFENILGNAYFWSADLSSSQPKTFMADCHCYMWQILDNSPNHGFSVRCVKEKEKAE